MADHPEVQHRIQKELDSVVEPGQYVEDEHFEKLPYMAAAIKEALRFRPVSGNSPPRSATRTFYWNDFEFPQGTVLLPFFLSSYQGPDDFYDPGRMVDNPTLDLIGRTEAENLFFGGSVVNGRPAKRMRHMLVQGVDQKKFFCWRNRWWTTSVSRRSSGRKSHILCGRQRAPLL